MTSFLLFFSLPATVSLLLIFSPGFNCYPDGAPDEACDDLLPAGHEDAVALNDQPFKIVTDKAKYAVEDTVTVSIEKTATARPQDSFRGFLVVAKDKNNLSGDNVGQFLPESDTSSKTIKCKTPASAITHVNSNAKNDVFFSWSPGDFLGEVVFTGTIVRNFTEYYSGVKSLPININ